MAYVGIQTHQRFLSTCRCNKFITFRHTFLVDQYFCDWARETLMTVSVEQLLSALTFDRLASLACQSNVSVTGSAPKATKIVS